MVAFHYFKELYDLFEEHKITNAKHLLMKMQARYIVMCDENMLLRKQIHDHISQQNLLDELTQNHAGYWFIADGLKQGPFCRKCYQNEELLILLEAEGAKWHCPHCQSITTQFKTAHSPRDTQNSNKKTEPCTIISFSKKRRVSS